MTGQTIAAAGMGLDWAQQSYSTPAIQHMSAAPPSSGSYGLHTATVASSLPSGFQSNNQSSATNTNAASAGFPQAHHAPQQPTGMPNIRPAWSTANNQESQSNTPIGRPIPVVGSEREGVAPLTPWKQAAAQGATPAQPGDCVPGYIDPQLPKDYMKILTRTVYVGGITPDITKEQIRDLFETIGRIDTVTVNYAKFNAFVKFLTRAEADLVKERFHKYMFNKSILKMGWGCGYGPKEFFDYTTGETLFPLSRMTETEKRTIATSPRGGGPIEGGMVVEEPDFGWPQKGEVCKGKYSHGQIPYAPGYMEAKQQKESGGFPQSAAAPPQFGGYATRPRPPMPGAFGAVQRPPFQPPFHPMHAAGGLGGRGADILVVADRQYDDRDDRDRWRNKQVQDRGEEHVVVLGGGDDEETTAEHDGANDGAGEDGMRRRDKFSNESQHGGPHDWYPRPGTEFGPDGYGPGPDMHMRPPPGFPHGMPPPGWRPGPFPPDYWGPPMPGHGWAGPPPGAGGPMGRKRQYSPDPDARDVRGEDDGERRRRSRWE
ncbi:hypothetical protein BC832DRAFT_230696 [Gaertneriomyces semiglobifer]|nr:hypothetical protein BC832DRAFT_230696 [Gaertneriomyces semiglobifer]